MTTNLWTAWLFAAVIALSGVLGAPGSVGSDEPPDASVCGAVVDDGSPF
jgi:hypothetical protein